MKPLDQFVQQMIESAQHVRANDPAAATDIIQRALRQAGLMNSPDMPPAPPGAPRIIDLNAAPAWRELLPSRLRAGAHPLAPSARQVELPAGATFTDGVFACSEGTRRYKLYIPASAQPANSPLVVMLHGCTQDADDFAAGTSMNAVAEEYGCLVLYPEQDRGANPTNCWNWFDATQQSRDTGEPAILAGMTRHIVDAHAIDRDRVYVTGLSAGGAMAAILAVEYPDLYAAVGVHSGLAAGSGKDMISGLHAMKRPGRAARAGKRVPIIVFHGDADQVVHPGNGTAVLRQFVDAHAGSGTLTQDVRSDHAAGRSFTRTSWRGPDGRNVAEHWLVHGAGHAWQGGTASGSHTDPTGPSASREMLAFFLDGEAGRFTLDDQQAVTSE